MRTIRIYIVTIILSFILLVGCNTGVSDSEAKEIKKVVDAVLSYDGGYDDNVNKYVSREIFNDSNYVVFYSYFLGDTDLIKYESEIKSIIKDGDKYTACIVINMEAVGEFIDEEGEGEEVHQAEAEGNNVPVEVTLLKKDGQFYLEKSKEYNSLEEAIKENDKFK